MHSKKLLSVLLALTLVCACVVGMLMVNASASTESANLTVTADGASDGDDATFGSLSDALKYLKDYNRSWEDEAVVTITIAEGAGAQDATVTDGILFGLETQFRQNGTRLPIIIAGPTADSSDGATLTPVFGEATNIACANSYTFRDLTFGFGTKAVNFYAGSGEVEFDTVKLGAVAGADSVANLYGDNFTANAFAGWDAPADGELIETGLTFSGSFDYGAKLTTETGVSVATAGRLCAAGYTGEAWENATESDAITAINTSVTLELKGSWTDADEDGVVDSGESSSITVRVGSALGIGSTAKTPVAEVNLLITDAYVYGYTMGARGESKNYLVRDYGLVLNVELTRGGYAQRVQGIQYLTAPNGEVNITVDGGCHAKQLRADCGYNTVANAKLTLKGKLNLRGTSGSSVQNFGINGMCSGTVSNENHIYANITSSASAAQIFNGSRGEPKGPVTNIVYEGANIPNFYGLGTTGAGANTPVTNIIKEGAVIGSFFGAGSATTETVVSVTNKFECDGSGEITTFNISNGAPVTNLTNDYSANWVGNYYALFSDKQPVGTLHNVIRGDYDAAKVAATVPAEYELTGLTTEIYSNITGDYVGYAEDAAFTAANITNIIRGNISGNFYGNKKAATSVTNIIDAKAGESVTISGDYFGSYATTSNSGGTAVENNLKGVPVITDGKATGSNVVLGAKFYGTCANVTGDVVNFFDGIKMGNTGSAAGCYGTAGWKLSNNKWTLANNAFKVTGNVQTTIRDTYVNSRYYMTHQTQVGNTVSVVEGASNFAGRIWSNGQGTTKGTVKTIIRAYEDRVPTIGILYGSYAEISGKIINKIYDGNIDTCYAMHNASCAVENYIYGGTISSFTGYNGESTKVPSSITNYIYGGEIEAFYGGARNNNAALTPAPTVNVVNNICKDPESTSSEKPVIALTTFYGGAYANTQGYEYNVTNNVDGVIIDADDAIFYGGSRGGIDVKVTNNITDSTFTSKFYGTGSAPVGKSGDATVDESGNPIYVVINTVTGSTFNSSYSGMYPDTDNFGNFKSEITESKFKLSSTYFLAGNDTGSLTGNVDITLTDVTTDSTVELNRSFAVVGNVNTTYNSCDIGGSIWGNRGKITGTHTLKVNGGSTGFELCVMGTNGVVGTVNATIDKYGDEIPEFGTAGTSVSGLAASNVNAASKATVNVTIKAGIFHKPILEGNKSYLHATEPHKLNYDFSNIYLAGDITLMETAVVGTGGDFASVIDGVKDVESVIVYLGGENNVWTAGKTYLTVKDAESAAKITPYTQGYGAYLKKTAAVIPAEHNNNGVDMDVFNFDGATLGFSASIDVTEKIVLNLMIPQSEAQAFFNSNNLISTPEGAITGAIKYSVLLQTNEGSILLGEGMITSADELVEFANGKAFYAATLNAVAPNYFDKEIDFAGTGFAQTYTVFTICESGIEQYKDDEAIVNLFTAIYNYGASVCEGFNAKTSGITVSDAAADPKTYSANGLGVKFNTVSMLMGDAIGIRFTGTITDVTLAQKLSLYVKDNGSWKKCDKAYYSVNVDGNTVNLDFFVSVKDFESNLFFGIYIDGNEIDAYTGIQGTCAAEMITSIKGLTEYVYSGDIFNGYGATEQTKVKALAELAQACVDYQG